MFINKISRCMTFPTKSYQIVTTTSCYRGHSAILQCNTTFATVHSQVTVGGCSVEYEYKLLYVSLLTFRMPYTNQHFIYLYNIAAGPHEGFLKTNFPVRHGLFAKLLGTSFVSIQ